MRPLTKLFDWRDPDSLAARLRKRRYAVLEALIGSLPRPAKVLDVGGTQAFWEAIECADVGVTICLLNLEPQTVTRPNFKSVVGDATDMRQFGDEAFDLVFSNSVIEHVGDYDSQARMANEIIRVGRRYLVQTPNRDFPIEPHFVFPYFDALPLSMRVWLVMHLSLGWYPRIPDRQQAIREIMSIRLLRRAELARLFPGATLRVERFLGLAKSFLIYK